MKGFGFPIKEKNKIRGCFFIITCNPCKLLKDWYTQITSLATQDLMHLFQKKGSVQFRFPTKAATDICKVV